MRTFTDWLHFNNFEPFLEDLESMGDSCTGLGIDIFKDAVPLPGVSMKYLLRGTLNKREPLSCTPQGSRPTKFSKARLSGGRAWSYVENENPYVQIPRREDASKSSGLRHQRTVPKHNGGRCALGASAQESRKLHRSSAERQMVWLRRGGHRGAKRVMDEVRRNAAVVLRQTRSKQDCTAAHERLIGAQQTQTHARSTKAG